MCFPCQPDAFFKYFAHSSIVPPAHVINIKPVGALFLLHATQRFRNGCLGGLVLLGNRYAISIVPNKNSQRHLEYACSIHGFPKRTFGSGSVANGAKTYFISIMRKIREFL